MSSKRTHRPNPGRLQFPPAWLPMSLGLLHNTSHETVFGRFLTDRGLIESWLATRDDIDRDGFRTAWAEWLVARGETEFG